MQDSHILLVPVVNFQHPAARCQFGIQPCKGFERSKGTLVGWSPQGYRLARLVIKRSVEEIGMPIANARDELDPGLGGGAAVHLARRDR